MSHQFHALPPPPPPPPPPAIKRQDPYGTIGHYPEMHMDIHELDHHEIHSDHEGDFGCHHGGGYGWCPDGIGFSDHHHGHHHHHHHNHHDHHGYEDDYDHEGSGEDEHDDEHHDRRQHVKRRETQTLSLLESNATNKKEKNESSLENEPTKLSTRVYHGVHNDTAKPKIFKIQRRYSDYLGQDNGSDDYIDHEQFIEPPNPEPQSFNGHIYLAIPHLREQLPEEPHQESKNVNKKTTKDENVELTDRHTNVTYKANVEPEEKQLPEYQDKQDQGMNRVVHVTFHGEEHDHDDEKRSKLTGKTKDLHQEKDNNNKTEKEFGLFQPLCKDSNGKVKLDIDGKRQLINTKPCHGKGHESLKDSVVASLLNDDDIMPDDEKHEQQLHEEEEREWEEDEGKPYFIISEHRDHHEEPDHHDRMHELPETGLRKLGQKNLLSDVHDNENVNVHPALPFPLQQLQRDHEPPCTQEQCIQAMVPEHTVSSENITKTVQSVIQSMNKPDTTSSNKTSTREIVKKPLEDWESVVNKKDVVKISSQQGLIPHSKHNNHKRVIEEKTRHKIIKKIRKTHSRSGIFKTPANALKTNLLCKDNSGKIKLDIDGKRQLIDTKPCHGKVHESLKDSVVASLLNDDDIMPDDEKHEQQLHEEEEREWEEDEGKPYFMSSEYRNHHEEQDHHEQIHELPETGLRKLGQKNLLDDVHDNENVNVHPALPFPLQQLQRDHEPPCTQEQCIQAMVPEHTVSSENITKTVQGVIESMNKPDTTSSNKTSTREIVKKPLEDWESVVNKKDVVKISSQKDLTPHNKRHELNQIRKTRSRSGISKTPTSALKTKLLCKDNSGKIKLDIDGKRQLINTKPCHGKVHESLKDSVVASLLDDDDIMPDDEKHEEQLHEEEEREWEEDEGKPYFMSSEHRDHHEEQDHLQQIHELPETGLRKLGQKNLLDDVHDNENVNVHPALPFPLQQLQRDHEPPCTQEQCIQAMVPEHTVSSENITKTVQSVIGSMNTPDTTSSNKTLTREIVKKPLEDWESVVNKKDVVKISSQQGLIPHNKHHYYKRVIEEITKHKILKKLKKTPLRSGIFKTPTNILKTNLLCKDNSSKIKLDIDGKRQFIDTKPCHGKVHESLKDSVVASLLNDDDIMPDDEKHEQHLHEEEEREWEEDEGKPYFPIAGSKTTCKEGACATQVMVPERAVTPKHIAKTIQDIVRSQKKQGKTVKEVYLYKQPIGQRHISKHAFEKKKKKAFSRRGGIRLSELVKKDITGDHHHRTHYEAEHPYVGENGSDDFHLHDTHIHLPDMNIDKFNGHIHPAIPHFHEQLEEEVHHFHWNHHHHHDHDHHDHHHEDNNKEHDEKEKEHEEPHKEHMDHHHHDEQHPEPQHPQDHDEDRIVHVHSPHPWLVKQSTTNKEATRKDNVVGESVQRQRKMKKSSSALLKRHQTHHLDDEEDDDGNEEEDDDDDDCEDECYGFEGEDGSNDFADHHIHIHQPDPNPQRFNNHIHPAIPHLYEQVEHEPYQPHYWTSRRHHWAFPPQHYHNKGLVYGGDNNINKHGGGGGGGDGDGDAYHGPPAEHQHPEDRDEDRLVHISPHLHRHYAVDGIHQYHHDDEDDDENDDEDGDGEEEEGSDKRSLQKTNPSPSPTKIRSKRHVRHRGFHHSYEHSYDGHHHGDGDDDDDDIDEEDAYRRTTGRDVAHLSYETEEYGRDMEHDIEKETHHVEDISDNIENSINNGIARVTHVGYNIEAPDYDRRGHFYPNVHQEDVEEEVESRFPHASQRDLIDAVVEDHYHRQQEHFPIGRRVHYHSHHDDDDDDDDDDK